MATSPDHDRGLPASPDAERSILGGILLENEHYYDDLSDLAEEEFSLDSNRKIFSAMSAILTGLEEGFSKADLVTVVEVLKKRKQVGIVGGVAYIASLTEGLPRRQSLDEYVHIVKEKARLRRLIHICNGVVARAADQVDVAQKIAADLQDDLVDEAAEGGTDAVVRIGDITAEIEAKVERGRKLGTERTAAELTWGVDELDTFTRGAFLGDMTVLSGESGGFKTSLMLQMVLSNAREGTPCGVFSIEMPKEKLASRAYPQMGDIITASMMRDPRLMNLHTHVPEMHRLSRELKKLPIWIDDSPQQINRLIARMRMMIRKFAIKLFAVDYFQLITMNPARTEVEADKAGIFALRDFIKSEPGVHLLLLSQYSKSKAAFRGKKMRRSKDDLHGTGALHHAAQNILLLKVESPIGLPDNQLLEADFDFDKQRDGRIGNVQSMLDRSSLRFAKPKPIFTT